MAVPLSAPRRARQEAVGSLVAAPLLDERSRASDLSSESLGPLGVRGDRRRPDGNSNCRLGPVKMQHALGRYTER